MLEGIKILSAYHPPSASLVAPSLMTVNRLAVMAASGQCLVSDEVGCGGVQAVPLVKRIHSSARASNIRRRLSVALLLDFGIVRT